MSEHKRLTKYEEFLQDGSLSLGELEREETIITGRPKGSAAMRHKQGLQLVKEHGYTCFLGGKISKKNPLTVHHMVPIRLGGRNVLANLALLCRLEHDMFNVVERFKPNKGDEFNDYFRYFKITNDLEALEQMRDYIIEELYDLGYCIEERKKLFTVKKM